jgi:hypothetical protein
MSATSNQPEKGLEAYVRVRVTEMQGQVLPEPKIEHYHPGVVASVLALKGLKGEIEYDPRTAAQKKQVAPANDTVKSAEPLADAASYRTRYRELFHEEAEFNLSADGIKRIVDRAEAKLAELTTGITPIDPEEVESEAERVAREAKEAQAKQDAEAGLPTNKKDWFALFQKEFPDDATAYDDITVTAIREKLGK